MCVPLLREVATHGEPHSPSAIVWYPDLGDGVRLDIRPLVTVQDVSARGASVLRWKPNVKWREDRGKNQPGSPWGEVRDNDKHLTLAEKQAARGK